MGDRSRDLGTNGAADGKPYSKRSRNEELRRLEVDGGQEVELTHFLGHIDGERGRSSESLMELYICVYNGRHMRQAYHYVDYNASIRTNTPPVSPPIGIGAGVFQLTLCHRFRMSISISASQTALSTIQLRVPAISRSMRTRNCLSLEDAS